MDYASILRKPFAGDQSNGWNLQKSEIRSVCALSRLFFILAVATLYVTAQGTQVVAKGCVAELTLTGSGQQLFPNGLGLD